MNEFFAGGGTTKFIDRVAASLGIHASTIKIVSIYEGSLVINYDIELDDDDNDTSDNSTNSTNSTNGTNSTNNG